MLQVKAALGASLFMKYKIITYELANFLTYFLEAHFNTTVVVVWVSAKIDANHKHAKWIHIHFSLDSLYWNS